MMTDGKIYNYTLYLEDTQKTYEKVTGIDGKTVGTHSHRSGGFQAAMRNKVNPRFILQQGYWKSMRGTDPYKEKMTSHHDIDMEKLSLLRSSTI